MFGELVGNAYLRQRGSIAVGLHKG
jgi:hypothetical protein